MTDYTKLVEALRCCIPYPPEKCVGCTYNIGNNECAVRMMMTDAAAAIEALQAELEKKRAADCWGCKCEKMEASYRLQKRGEPVLLAALPSASPWHRVEEELPNDGDWAIFTNGKVVSVERFKVDAYNHFFPASEWLDFEDAIAWMPLPEPPKEDA